MSIPPDHTPGPGQLRVSDREREAHADLLRQHTADGRMTPEELAERLDLAYGARTQDELAVLLRDLPPTAPAQAAPVRPRRQRDRRDELIAFVLVNLMLIGIWAATGAGYFWPIWPLLGWGLGLVSHGRGRGCRSIRERHRGYAS